jgi:hypothetical protein
MNALANILVYSVAIIGSVWIWAIIINWLVEVCT